VSREVIEGGSCGWSLASAASCRKKEARLQFRFPTQRATHSLQCYNCASLFPRIS
jgi:hypothetical protein